MILIIRRLAFLGLIPVGLLAWEYSQQRKVSLHYLDQDKIERVLTVPQRDRQRLFNFMEKLFAEDNFAYTLVGSKPVSWASYKASFPFISWPTFFDSLKKYNRTLDIGWKTWEKYRHLFPSNIFYLETPKYYSGSKSIILLNEKEFNRVIQENKLDFENILRKEIKNGTQLLKETQSCSLMNDILMGHQALIGIILGYGRENSWQFLEQSKKKESLSWVWNEDEYWTDQEPPPRNSSPIAYNLSHYSCPSFAGLPTSEESLHLKSEYLKTKQIVVDYYKGKDFLEATLSLLAGYRPEE